MRKFLLTYYLILLAALIVSNYIFPYSHIIKLILIVIFILFPLFLVLSNRKRFNLFFEIFFYWLTAAGVLAFSFRYIRELFPLPEIGKHNIVGYTQYFGYPFYFDAIFFNLFIFLPILAFVLVVVRSNFIRKEK